MKLDGLIGWLRGRAFRVRSLLTRGWWHELDSELEFHLEMETQKLVREGLSPEEAHRRARLRFGSSDAAKEQVRVERGVSLIDDVWRDVRHAFRGLARSPGFASACVITLAVGIGATTAIVSVVHGTLLAPLPFPDGERMAVVWETDRFTGTLREAASLPDFWDFEERSRTFAAMAAFQRTARNLTGPGREPARVEALEGTHDLLSVLGLPLLRGRAFEEAEARPGGDRVAVLGHGFWQAAFGGDEEVLGRTLVLDDVAHRIVGVLGADVAFPATADVWLPLQEDAETLPRYTHRTTVVGRLAPGVDPAAAQAELSDIAADLEATYPENSGRGVFVEPLRAVLYGNARAPLLVLLAAAGLVLLIACVNVANLLLARGAARTHELAISAALGAGRRRLAQRFIVESALLVGGGLVLGIGLSHVGLRAVWATAPPEVRSLGSVGIELPVLLTALAICGAIGLAFGMVPVRQAGRLDVGRALTERSGDGRGDRTSRARRLLVVGQTALAATLLVGAGLLMNSLLRLRAVDAGFDTENTLRVTMLLPESRYPRDFSRFPDWPEITNFNRLLIERVEGLPGVTSAAVGTNHPLDPGLTNSFNIVDREAAEDQGELATRIVSDRYFETVGARIVEGRGFEPGEDATTPMVLLLNQAAVERYFPDEDPIGLRIAFWGLEREVVGIVANERFHGFEREPPPAQYVPLYQAPPVASETLMVRSTVDPLALVDAVRREVWALDRDVAVYDVATMDQTAREALSRWRFTTMLLASFAGVAILLAAVGLHGLLTFLVARRTREIGVRVAMGATRRGILSMILGQGMRLVVVGLMLGLLAATALSTLLGSLLFGVTSTDPLTYAVAAMTLLFTALLSCTAPALRATGVDPARALRVE